MLRKTCGLLICLCLYLSTNCTGTVLAGNNPPPILHYRLIETKIAPFMSTETYQAIVDILSGQPQTEFTSNDVGMCRFGDTMFTVFDFDPAFDVYLLFLSSNSYLPDTNTNQAFGAVRLSTRSIVLPFIYNDAHLLPGDKFFVVKHDENHTDSNDTPYYEVDYAGNETPVYIDGNVSHVGENGYLTTRKEVFYDMEGYSLPEGQSERIYTLLDQNHHIITEYRTQKHLLVEYIFRNGMTVAPVNRVEWADGRWRYAEGNELCGIINLRGEFVIPAAHKHIVPLDKENHFWSYHDGLLPETLVAESLAATDPSDWAADMVEDAIAAGIIPVTLQNHYQQPITRAEFCALAVALYERHTGKPVLVRLPQFTDTMDVNVLKMPGFITIAGTGGGKFSPNDPLTREQAAVLLVELSRAVGKQLPLNTATFTDFDEISSWAQEPCGQAQSTGIMSGVGDERFAPKDTYTREQCIATILNIWVTLEK